MTVAAYLQRIGLDPGTVQHPDRTTLARLQSSHVTSVPFETLSITGDPHGNREGEGVRLAIPHLYHKIVEEGRGGYCFELNGLFHWLLVELGYDVDRVAARVVSDGALRTPANHHTNLIHLERTWVADVGMGPPMLRTPLPVSGSTRTDDAGVEWSVRESDRPDVLYSLAYRTADDPEWTPRYVFDATPRSLDYFEATNDYLQTAPESPFTGEPFVGISTESGYRTLTKDTLTEVSRDETRKRSVSAQAWHATLRESFGLSYSPESPVNPLDTE